MYRQQVDPSGASLDLELGSTRALGPRDELGERQSVRTYTMKEEVEGVS